MVLITFMAIFNTDSRWYFVISGVGNNSLMLTVKDGCTDPGTQIVVDKKKSETPDRQLWKKRYVYNFNFYYLVSKLGDNVKLGFKVKMINISF